MLYEPRGVTFEGLLHLLGRALQGRKAQGLGIFSSGNSREIDLLQGWSGIGGEQLHSFEGLQCLSTSVTSAVFLSSNSAGRVHFFFFFTKKVKWLSMKILNIVIKITVTIIILWKCTLYSHFCRAFPSCKFKHCAKQHLSSSPLMSAF